MIQKLIEKLNKKRLKERINCRRTPASGNGSAKPQCCRACPGIRWH